ncbi:hypothetical protein ASG29_01120 [Sphingomonas sp. Leaf412]|nr:hypothetical protein ASG29_01120 [Sphingomonas sp. Leaf412]
MRLMQVRDWLAGQSWWDVGQHRLDGGRFAMHWSRLVDLPVAGVVLAFDPLVGRDASTRIAMTVVPLVTLLAIMALAAAITRRVAGAAPARLAVLFVPLSVPIIYQARPMRIDHHGWQIVLALVAVLALLGRPTPRRGALAGLALATLLTVSLEGLPIAAAIAGVAALAWALDPRRGGFLAALGATLAGAAALLHLATRGPGWATPACDAVAPAWLAALAIAGIGVAAATAVAYRTVALRLASLALVGGASAAGLVALAPDCLSGPFATLPTIVYRLWYLCVREGRPLWEQMPAWAVMTIGLPLAGLVGTIGALRERRGARRTRWAILLTLLLAATLLALLVNRAGATANALAVPGAAVLLQRLLARARAVPRAVPRTLATAGALLAASPGQAGAILLTLANTVDSPEGRAARVNDWHRRPCADFTDARVLARLGATTVFAPIDISPDIVATTPLHAIAGGYHRNAAAMARVMEGFTAAPDAAKVAIAATGASHVVACPGLNETDLYRQAAPDGLWSRLERGERIAWLRQVPMPGPVLAWRIVPDRAARVIPLREGPPPP